MLKVRGLEAKKKHYEQVLQRELDGLDDEFNTLKFLAQELRVRANSIRFQKAAYSNPRNYQGIPAAENQPAQSEGRISEKASAIPCGS